MPRQKLTSENLDDIIFRGYYGGELLATLAEEYKVSLRYIRMIIQEHEEKEKAEDRNFRIACDANWVSDSPAVIRDWLKRVYASGVCVEYAGNRNGFDSLYASERLAYYQSLPDRELLRHWETALLDAYFAFSPLAHKVDII